MNNQNVFTANTVIPQIVHVYPSYVVDIQFLDTIKTIYKKQTEDRSLKMALLEYIQILDDTALKLDQIRNEVRLKHPNLFNVIE